MVRTADQDAHWWFSGHVPMGGDPGEDPKPAGGDYRSCLVQECLRNKLEDVTAERNVWVSLLKPLAL